MVTRSKISAHHGLRDWLLQRASAVIMVIYTLLVVSIFAFHSPMQYAGWKALFDSHWMRLASLVFLLSMFIHAWVGMQDILLDYVHAQAIRHALRAAIIISLAAYGIWSIHILWGA